MVPDRIARLTKMLEASPADPFLHHALALEQIKAGDETGAEHHFRINLEAVPAYVATYYHLGKLLERAGQQQAAIAIYEQGMTVAKEAKDNHSYNELQAAYEELAY